MVHPVSAIPNPVIRVREQWDGMFPNAGWIYAAGLSLHAFPSVHSQANHGWRHWRHGTSRTHAVSPRKARFDAYAPRAYREGAQRPAHATGRARGIRTRFSELTVRSTASFQCVAFAEPATLPHAYWIVWPGMLKAPESAASWRLIPLLRNFEVRPDKWTHCQSLRRIRQGS